MRDLGDLRSKRRWLALLFLGFVPTACGRSCGCVDGEKTYETLEGKVNVSLVRKVKWTGGKIPGPVTSFFLHVETTPPFDEPIRGCDHVDMVEDDSGRHIGFRCKGTASWSVLRLRGGDRRIRECDAPIGEGKKPDFTKLESVRKSADRILSCPDIDVYSTNAELTRSIAEDEGAAAAIDFVSQTLASREVPEAFIVDPFDRGLDALAPSSRTKAMAQLCEALDDASGKEGGARYLRAALRCPFDSPNAGRGAVTIFGALLSPHGDRSKTAERALYWAAMIGSEKTPAEIGRVACAAATTDLAGSRRAIVAGVLGQTKTKCDGVVGWLESPALCSSNVDCDGGLCSESELASDTAFWREALSLNADGGLRSEPFTPNEERAVLRAAQVRGGLPKPLVLANARRHYALAGADDESLMPCSDGSLNTGASCRCPSLPDYVRCAISADGGPIPRVRYEYCSLHVDDAKKRFDDIKRICESEGARCDFSSLYCCGGLACEAIVGGSGGVCKRVVERGGAKDARAD